MHTIDSSLDTESHTIHIQWIVLIENFVIYLFNKVILILQVFGMMTKPLIGILLPQPKYTMSMLSSEPSSPKSFTIPLLDNDQNTPSPLDLFLRIPSHTVHHYWRRFDDAFMRPVFGGRGFVPFVPGSPTEDPTQQWQTEGAEAIDENKSILIQTRR